MSVSRTEPTASTFWVGDETGAEAETAPGNTVGAEFVDNTSVSISEPVVAILLCTHHGSQFLAEQLDSIRAQDHSNHCVWVSDDGSADDTHQILEQHQSYWGQERFCIQSGPQDGFVANFLSLTCFPDIEADYFAYADQDDIWEHDKLSRAIAKLESVPDNIPALYCSRTRLIDKNGRDIGFSPLFDKPPGFANALIQNIGGGNTMVMNKAAREVLRAAGERVVVSHDWWAYLIISGAGGTVFYDPYPTVRYRQHDNNLMGSNSGWYARLRRIQLLFKGRFRNWNNINTGALQQIRNLLTPENQRILDEFCTARDRWLIPRLFGIWKSGIYRQTLLGNLGLIVATILKKI